jgi:hypothetical protein
MLTTFGLVPDVLIGETAPPRATNTEDTEITMIRAPHAAPGCPRFGLIRKAARQRRQERQQPARQRPSRHDVRRRPARGRLYRCPARLAAGDLPPGPRPGPRRRPRGHRDVDDPEAVFHHAVSAGATPTAPPANEHGWRLARITDPFGHQWEIGRPLGTWPPPHPNHHRQLAQASAGSRSQRAQITEVQRPPQMAARAP